MKTPVNTPKYINPFTDFGFKKIFGEEANKDLLMDFLNELLASQNQHIKELTYKKTNKQGISPLDRNVVFDLYCENEKGEKFTVELQKAKQAWFKDRMLYYSSFSIQEQGIKGDWNYQLKAIYVIGILDFVIDENKNNEIVVSHNQLMDKDRHTVFYDKLSFITLQMPNFNKTEDQLETNFDKWLFVIKNLHRLDNIPGRLKTKLFEKLFRTAAYSTLSKDDRDRYEESLKYYNDLKNSLDTAFDEGKEEARLELLPIIKAKDKKIEEKDLAIEIERRQKERVQKQKEEVQNKLKSFVLKQLKKGKSISEISDDLDLSENEIKKFIEGSK